MSQTPFCTQVITYKRHKKLWKIFSSDVKVSFELYGHLWSLQVLYSKLNYIYWVLSYSMDFKAPWELWNPLSKAVPGKFHGSGGHSKCNCLQDQANFHRSWAWQIVHIFNTVQVDTVWSQYNIRTYSRFAPSQWEMALLCNDVSHWLGASLESVLQHRNDSEYINVRNLTRGTPSEVAW